MGLLSSVANSATANNSNVFNPTITIGENNRTSATTELDQKATAEASTAFDLGASVGVGVGGGSGSAGGVDMAKQSGAAQASQGTSPISGALGGAISNTTMLIITGVLAFGGLVLMLINKKKK